MFSFCMYCCKERCASIAIVIFSVLALLTSSATIYLMKHMRDDSYIWNLQSDPLIDDNVAYEQPEVEKIKQIVFWGVTGLCGLGIITSFLGLLTAKGRACCAISIFAFLTLIVTVAFFVIGGLLLTVTVASNFQID